MMRDGIVVLAMAVLLTGCGAVRSGMTKVRQSDDEPEPSPFGPTGIPAHLRAKTTLEEGTPVAAGGNQKVDFSKLTPENMIAFTDPDDPEGSIMELSSVLVAPSKGPWETDEKVARRRAASEGKPLLIWFTDSSGRSPLCRTLAKELFDTDEFEAWASAKLVRLRVDANFREKLPDATIDEQETHNIDRGRAVAELKKRYKILGHPSLVMLKPDGSVVGRYRGFKRGQAEYFWGQMKHGEAVAASAYSGWKKEMEAKGYRTWSDGRGKSLFAKLVSYSKGQLVLVEPDGTRSRTKETSLSAVDAQWIADQKAARGIE